MWNFSAPTRTSDVMARWRLTVVFALWALSMTLTAGKAQGQSCPATAGSMSLASVEEKRCVQAAGVTECSIVCRYGTSPTVKVRADWITKAPPGTDPRKGCTSKEHGWQNSWTRQIEAKWLFSTGANGDAATRDVIAALEPYALSCPAPKARTTVGAGTRGGRPIPRGKIKHATGTVGVYDSAFNKWRPVGGETPVYPGDRVRTGRDSSAIVFISTASGAEDRIDVMPDSIVEVPDIPENSGADTKWLGKEPPWYKAIWLRLWGGGVHCTINRPPPKSEGEPSPFNVQTPTITTGTRGTNFILRHDAEKKMDFVFLKQGKLETKAGNETKMLTSGQQVYTQNGRLSPVYQLDDFSWQRAVASGVQPGLEAFANAKPVETVITRPSQTVVRTQPNRDGDRVTIRFEARMYNTTYHRGVDGGIPYDAYYFPIILLDQTQATQNGEKLWGRFVRSPSHDYRDQSSVQWWFVTWDVQDGPVWVQQERKIASPQLGP